MNRAGLRISADLCPDCTHTVMSGGQTRTTTLCPHHEWVEMKISKKERDMQGESE